MGNRVNILFLGEVAIPPNAIFNNSGNILPSYISGIEKSPIEWSDGTISDGVRQPICAYLIETGTKKILVDTGVGDFEVINSYRKSRGDRFYLKAPKQGLIEEQLNNIGVKTSQIEIIIATHLHWDHIGGYSKFKNAKFIIQKDEIPLAIECPKYAPHYFSCVRDEIISISERIEIVDGDAKVSDGIRVMKVGGHTPGSQVVIVHLDKGTVILTGDVIPRYDNWKYLWVGPSGNIWNLGELVEAYRKIELLESTIIPSHDWGILRIYPDGIIK